jgi:hypothetical protein
MAEITRRVMARARESTGQVGKHRLKAVLLGCARTGGAPSRAAKAVGGYPEVEKDSPQLLVPEFGKTANGGATETYYTECDQWASANWPLGQ